MGLDAQVYGLPYPILIVLVILSLLFPLINISLASTPSALINPFVGSEDLCGDGIDNDGNGFVDDNCGTISLKVTNNISGVIANISSMCHEDCDIETEDDQ
jgi:hypothetical protein